MATRAAARTIPATTTGEASMTLKSKLVPFFAAGALVSSLAAPAQTARVPGGGRPAGQEDRPDVGDADDPVAEGKQREEPAEGAAQLEVAHQRRVAGEAVRVVAAQRAAAGRAGQVQRRGHRAAAQEGG